MPKLHTICWLVGVAFAVQIALDGVLDHQSPFPSVNAQTAEEEDPRPERNVQPMSLDFYERLSKIQELMDEGEFDKVKEQLDRMLSRSRGRHGNEMTAIYRNLVFWANETGQEDLAVEYLKTILQYREEIPYHVEESVLYQIAQYATQRGDIEEALEYLLRFMDLSYKQSSRQLYFLASTYWHLSYKIEEQAYAETERRAVGLEPAEKRKLEDEILESYKPEMRPHLENVIHWMKIAMEKAPEEALAELQEQYGEEPVPEDEIPGIEVIKESWWKLLVVAHDRLDEFQESLTIWRLLATNHPKKEYFLGMYSSYSALEQLEEATFALEAAHVAGFLDTSDLVISFAQKIGGAFSPIRALWILEDGIDAELVEVSPRVRKSQGQYASISREIDKAIEYFEAYVEDEPEARIYHQLATRYFSVGRFTDCIAATKEAIELDAEQEQLRDVTSVKILQAICMFSDDDLGGSMELLKSIRTEASQNDDDDIVDRARSYINYVESLQKQVNYRKEIEELEREYREEKQKALQQTSL